MNELETMPIYEARSFAEWVAKATEEYFKDPDVKRRFKKWQKEQKELQKKSDNNNEEGVVL